MGDQEHTIRVSALYCGPQGGTGPMEFDDSLREQIDVPIREQLIVELYSK